MTHYHPDKYAPAQAYLNRCIRREKAYWKWLGFVCLIVIPGVIAYLAGAIIS